MCVGVVAAAAAAAVAAAAAIAVCGELLPAAMSAVVLVGSLTAAAGVTGADVALMWPAAAALSLVFYGSDDESKAERKDYVRAYQFDADHSSGINWDNPSLCDLYQDNDTDRATQAYTNRGRTAEVLAVLAAYGFTDLTKNCEQLPSPCFEQAVRKHCSKRSRSEPLPSVADIAATMRRALEVRRAQTVQK